MKNLFVAISDVHISLKNLEVSLEVLRQGLNKARELKVPFVIAGDLNDTKAVMRSEWVSALIELFTEFGDVEIHIIDGNHDLNNKSGSKSSLAFLHLIDNVFVYHEPEEVEFSGYTFFMLPYQKTNQEFMEQIERCRKEKLASMLICHQGFMGAFMGDYVVDESSVDPKSLSDFDLVLSGHYHKHQWVEDNIMYFGSPFTVNFGEAGHEKFFWVIQADDYKVIPQMVFTQVRRHVQFTLEPGYEASQKPVEYTNLREGDLLKVIMKGPKEFALSEPNFEDCPTANVTFIPDIERQSEERISTEIVHQPKKVIETYLEGAYTEYDKKELANHLWPIIADILNSASNKGAIQNKVLKIRAKNFLSYQELEYDFTSKGLTLIEGHDEDHDISTGAGKSSFLDVVAYGLFGKTSKKLKADEVINRQAKKDMFVQVEVQTPEGIMWVNRYRKDSTHDNDLHFLYAGQGEPTRGKDNVETQKLLEKELGMDLDMFLISSYFTQFGDIDKFLSDSDSNKKKLISEISDTKIYDKMVDAIKEHLKGELKKLAGAEDEYIAKSSRYDTLKSSQDDFDREIECWNNNHKEKLQTLSEQKSDWDISHQEDIANLEAKSQDYESGKQLLLKEAQKKSDDWELEESQNVQKIHNDITIKKKLLDETKAKSVLPDLPDTENEKLEIKGKLDIIESLKQESSKIGYDIGSKQGDIATHEQEISDAHSKDTTTNCGFCYQPMSEEHIQKHISQIEPKIKVLETEIKILREKKSEIDVATQKEVDLKKREKEIHTIETEYMVKLGQAKENERQLPEIQKDIENLEKSLENRPTNPNTAYMSQLVNETNPHINSLELKKKEVNPTIKSIEEEEARVNPHIDMSETNKIRLKEALEKKESLASEVQGIQKSIDFTKWWKDAINIYIKSYLTDSFIEQINVLANEKLQQMFDGILSIHISATSESGKDTKEKISVTIFNKNEECSYNSLSGGERCRICFALNLAIRKVTMINMGFLMFDEVLNGLDDVGKAQVMRVFKELESEYETVFVIDHTTEFKSLFTNNIMVRKSNGVSSIVE